MMLRRIIPTLLAAAMFTPGVLAAADVSRHCPNYDECGVLVTASAEGHIFYVEARTHDQTAVVYEESNGVEGLQRGGCGTVELPYDLNCEARPWRSDWPPPDQLILFV